MHTQSIHTGYTPDIPERPSRRGVLAPAMLCAMPSSTGQDRAPADVPDTCRLCCDVLAPSPAMQAMQSCAVGFQQRHPTCICPSTSSILCVREDGRGTSHNTEHTHPPSPLCPCVYPLGHPAMTAFRLSPPLGTAWHRECGRQQCDARVGRTGQAGRTEQVSQAPERSRGFDSFNCIHCARGASSRPAAELQLHVRHLTSRSRRMGDRRGRPPQRGEGFRMQPEAIPHTLRYAPGLRVATTKGLMVKTPCLHTHCCSSASSRTEVAVQR
jgi:hypothetical protein